MRRLKLFFACLLMAVLSIGQVWAGTATATLQISSGVTANGNLTDDASNTWAVSSDGSYTSNNSYIQCGTNKANVSYIRLTTSAFSSKKITKVQVWGTSKANTNVSAKVIIGSVTIGTSSAYTTQNASSGGTEFSVDNTDEETGDLTIEISRASSSTGAIYFNKAIVTYEDGGDPDPVLESITIEGTPDKTTYEAGEEFDPTGLVATGHYDDSNTADLSSSVEWSYTPSGALTQGLTSVNVTATKGTVSSAATPVAITVNAAPTKSSLIFAAACGGSGTADDGAEWIVASDGTESNFDNGKGIHYGTSGASVQYIQLSTSDIEGTIKKVVVNASAASGVTASVSVTVGGNAFGGDAQSLSASAAEYTFEGSAEGEIIVTITKPSSATKAIYCKSIVVTYEGDGKEPAGLAYAAADAQKLAKLGVAFTAPTLSNDNNLAVSYASETPEVATVDPATGAVTIVATGKTVITASTEGDDTHKAGSASYTLYVATEAGTAEDPLTEASAKTLIDNGCTLNAYVKGTVATAGSLSSAGKVTLTLAGGMQFFRMVNVGGVAFTTETLPEFTAGDVVTAVGGLLKYNNTTYELIEDCQMVERIPYTAPKTSIANDQATAYTVAQALVYAADGVTYDLDDEVYVRGKVAIASTGLFSSKYLTYSISDDGTTENVLKVYNGLGIGGAAFESKDDILVGEVVIVKGKLTQHNTELEFAADNELVSKKPVATIAIENMELEFAEEAAISATITPAAAASTVVYNIKAGSDDVITLAVDQITAKSVAGTATIVATIDATDDYEGATKEFTVTVVEPAAPALPASLPFAFDGGRNDIESTQGMSQEGLDSDYGSSPKLKFNSTGDWVIVEIDSDPGKLTFDIIGNGFSGGSFTVQESANGTDYTNVVAYTELGAKSSKEATLAQATRFVKFIYTTKDAGNVALGNIAIAEYVAPAPVETPTISGEESFLNSTIVTLSCETDGATIYYTLEGTDPTTSSTLYSEPFELNATATVKAIAIKGSDVSDVAEKEFTKIEALETMDAIFAAATTAESTPADVYVTFDNWVVSGIKGSNAFVTDGTKGFVIYASSHGFAVGNILSGTVACKVQLYKGAAELTNLTSSTTGLTVTTGGTVTATTTTIDQLGAINTGALVTIENLSYDGTNLSDGTNTIKPYNGLYSGMSFENGKNYNVTGVVNYYDAQQIMPRSAADIEEIVDASAPEAPTFSPAGGEYTEAQNVTISCETEGAAIYYTIDGTAPDNTKTLYNGAISVAETMTIKAIAIKDDKSSAVATATYTINLPEEQDDVTGTWTLVTNATTLAAGKKVIIAQYVEADGAINTMASQSSNNRSVIASTVAGATLTPTVGTKVMTLADAGEGHFYLKTSDGEYLYNASGTKSYLRTKATSDDASWTIEVDADGVATITAVENTTRPIMRYNPNTSGSPLFNCYASGQEDIALYMLEEDTPEPPVEDWVEVRTGLSAGNYYTVCWPKAMTAIQGGTLWSFAGKDANMAYLIQEDAPFEAGKPYIIYATAEKLEAVVEGDDAAAESNNGLYGTLVDMTNSELLAAGATYMLKGNALRPVGGGHLDANRAYVKLSEISGGAPTNAPAHKVRAIPMQKDAATGIEDVQGDNVQSTKVLIDGQLFILRGEKMYNANGQLVK